MELYSHIHEIDLSSEGLLLSSMLKESGFVFQSLYLLNFFLFFPSCSREYCPRSLTFSA